MPTLGAALDLAKYEARNLRAHILGTAPSAPVTGQLYYNSADNTLYWWDNTAWIPAKSGPNTPIGTAGGDLTGTYPNPGIAPLVIVDGDVNGSAAIAESKLALASDAAAATPSRRTLGTGAQQAMPGNTRLDTIAAPTTPVNFNGQRVTAVADPTATTDAANKQYVDNTAQGLDAKASVKLASTTNIGASPPGGPQTVDGTAVANQDRVLLTGQTVPADNGIWIANTGGTWSRATDTDTWNELISAYVWVEQGTANADTGWVCTVNQGGTLGTSSIFWVQFSGAGSITAGGGLSKTGNTLDVGAGAGITVDADQIRIANDAIVNSMLADGAVNLNTADTAGVLPLSKGGVGMDASNPSGAATARSNLGAAGYYSSATHGASTTISIPQASHGCRATKGLIVQVQDEATGNVELPDVSVSAAGAVTVTFGVSVAANSKRVTIIG